MNDTEHRKRTLDELVDFLESQSDCRCVTEYGHNPQCPYEQIKKLIEAQATATRKRGRA